MKSPSTQPRTPADKVFLDYKDVMAILDVSRQTAYEVIYSLPHIKEPKVPLRVRRETFEKYLTDCEKASAVMGKLAKAKIVTVEGQRFYIREHKGRRMVLQLVNF
jgi:hypothetical protein